MNDDPHLSFVTTIRLPFALQAELDVIRMARASRLGHRPHTREIVLEALVAFVAAQEEQRKSGPKRSSHHRTKRVTR